MFQRRDLLIVGILSVVTLGLFNIWLIWRWTREMNAFLGREKYIDWLPLLLGIITLGGAGCVFESLYAIDVSNEVRARRLPVPEAESATLIVAFNIVALCFMLTGVGFIIGFPLGVAATVLMQRTLNRLAELELGGTLARASTAAPFSVG